MQPEQIRVRATRTHCHRGCARCCRWIQPGAFLVVVVDSTVGTVWYCLPCALALGVPRPQAQAVEG